MRVNSPDDIPPPWETPCPLCGALVPDWSQVCENCGRRVRTKEAAARAELAHIAYLQKQIPWLTRRSILPLDAADSLKREYDGRIAALNRIVAPTPDLTARPSPPAIPPLPANFGEPPAANVPDPTMAEPSQPTPLDAGATVPPERVAAFDRLFPSASDVPAAPTVPPIPAAAYDRPFASPTGPQAAPSTSAAKPSRPIFTGRAQSAPRTDWLARRQANPEELRAFFQAHGLKLVFALATMLVGYALKQFIAWQAVGTATIPVVLIALTFMFATFASRTRAENPWAAFSFHAMACVLAAFDVGVINRFWLGQVHLQLAFKPALLVATALGTGLAAMLLARLRETSYLHLLQGGILITVYSLLQFLRLEAWGSADMRAAPLPLFGVVYLGLSAVCFYFAGRFGGGRNGSDGSNRKDGNYGTASLTGVQPAIGENVGLGPEPASAVSAAAVTGQGWQAAWALWAHLYAAAIVALVSVNAILSEHSHLYDFAAVLLLAGVVYSVGAQMLQQPRAAYAAGGLFMASALLWLANSYTLIWPRFGFLLMGISAVGLALSAYNSRSAGASDPGLVTAWRRVARYTLILAATITALQVAAPWRLLVVPQVDAADAFTLAIQAVVSGGLLLLLGRIDARSEYTYGACAAWAAALVSVLEAVRAPIGAYAVAYIIYGGALYLSASTIRSRQAQPNAPPDAGANALARSGQVLVALGALSAASLTSSELQARWVWVTIAMALACTLYVVTAMQERTRRAVYSALAALAYTTGLLMWRMDSTLPLADLLSPFALGCGLASVGLEWGALYWMQGRKGLQGPKGQADEGDFEERRAVRRRVVEDPIAISVLIAAAAGLVSELPAVLGPTSIQHPWIAVTVMAAASAFVLAGRRDAASDQIRTAAAMCANASGLLLGAILCGLVGGPDHWSGQNLIRTSTGWAMLGWLFWTVGALLARRTELSVWTRDLSGNALSIALASAALCVTGAEGAQPSLGIGAITLIMAVCFGLSIAEAFRSSSRTPLGVSILLLLLAAAAHGGATDGGARFSQTSWSLFVLSAAASYFVLAGLRRSENTNYLTLGPLLLGFAIFIGWKARILAGTTTHLVPHDVAMSDLDIANHLWLIGGAIAGWRYFSIAKQYCRPVFEYLSALALTGTYCHGISYLVKSSWLPGIAFQEIIALFLLVWLCVLYAVGVWHARTAGIAGDPFRQVAVGLLACLATMVSTRFAAGLAFGTTASFMVLYSVMAVAFGLAAAETYRTAGHVPRALTVVILGLASIGVQGFQVRHPGATAWISTLWTLLNLGAAATYFGLSQHEKQPGVSSFALWPLALSYGLFEFWKNGLPPQEQRVLLGDLLLILTGLLASAAYLEMARRSQEKAFSYLGAIIVLGTYCHTLSLFGHMAPEWFALALLPMTAGQYVSGVWLQRSRAYLGEPLRAVGLTAIVCAALVVTVRATAGVNTAGHFSAIPGGVVTMAAFGGAIAESYLSKGALARALSFAAIGMQAIVFHVYAHNELSWLATAWTIAMMIAQAAYFFVAAHEDRPILAYAPLWPLLLGYTMYSVWKGGGLLSPIDSRVSDLLWVAGVAAAAFTYNTFARRFKTETFAYLAAVLLVGSYTHLLSILDPQDLHVDRYALLVLPLLAGMYLYGVRQQTDEFAGRPFQRTSLALSAFAIVCSTAFGDGILRRHGVQPDHAFITWTLAAYGMAYAAIALYRRTSGTIATATITVTAAYLHLLLSLSPYWSGSPAISWPQFAALTGAGGIAWAVLATVISLNLKQPTLATPLQGIAATLSVLCSIVAWATQNTINQGDWSLLGLLIAAAIWFILWRQQIAEVTWHIGVWNLLAAWVLAIQLHFGTGIERLDLYIIPFGMYLVLAGHRWAEQDQMRSARVGWWAGLIVMLTPCFALYWTRSPGMHHIVVLIVECVAATLWGLIRRIRAYVSAGFAYLVLLTVASWFRHVNDIAGTISALATGVALFVWVYYWLTHREKIDNWLLRVSGAWRAWRAWR